jgi:hypothetical protein
VTRHLTPAEHVDLAAGTLAPDRAAHASACAPCGREQSHLRESLGLLRDDRVPDPSPLYWEHQARRIASAIAAEPAPRQSPRWARFAWAAGAAAAVSVVAFVLVRESGGVRPAAGPPSGVAEQPVLAHVPAAEGGAWALVEELGAEVDPETASAALRPSPGAIDRAVLELDPDERAELAALLRAEMKLPES